MKGRTIKMIGSGVIALGALVAIGPRYLFPVCDFRETEAAAGTGGSMEGMSHGSMEGMSHGSMQGMSHGGETMASSTTMAHDHMACYSTYKAAIVIGALVALIGVAIILANKVSLRRISGAVLAAAGAAVVLTPLYIAPTCKNPEMFCNQGAKQLLIVLGGIAILSGGMLALTPEGQRDTITQPAVETT